VSARSPKYAKREMRQSFRGNTEAGPGKFRAIRSPPYRRGHVHALQKWEAVVPVYPLMRVAFVRGKDVFALSAEQVRPDLSRRQFDTLRRHKYRFAVILAQKVQRTAEVVALFKLFLLQAERTLSEGWLFHGPSPQTSNYYPPLISQSSTSIFFDNARGGVVFVDVARDNVCGS